jgi:serine/threonine protein kinase
MEFLKKSNHNLYRCHDKRTNKSFVMKLYYYDDLELSNSFLNEYRFTDLSHPNIIEINEYEEEVLVNDDGIYKKASYLLMERGKTDFAELISKKLFDSDEILVRTYFRQFVDAVKYLHEQKIFHLDLKPQNLVLGQDNQLKVIDFDHSISSSTETPLGKGTKNYRAPELIKEDVKDPSKCDVFSMGVILFYFLIGKLPYYEANGEVDDYWLYRMTDHFFEKLGNPISEEFKKLFRGMTPRDSEKRFSIAQIEDSAWFKGRVYNDEELAECIKNKIRLTPSF